MDSFLHKIFRSWIPTIIVAVAIGYLSLFPYIELGLLWEPSDVIKHFFAYLVLSIILYFPVKRITPSYSQKNRILLIIGICFIYGILLEIGQFFSPGRHPSFIDAIMNLLGALAGQMLITLFTRKSQLQK